MKKNHLAPLFSVAMVFVIIGVLFLILRPGYSLSPQERKQMDVLSGQLFVFDGVTNEIRRTRSFSAFEKQHKMMPYLQILSPHFERYNWPKDRPVRVTDWGDQIGVVWPLPPEIENQPIRWGGAYWRAALIDKKAMKIVSISQGG